MKTLSMSLVTLMLVGFIAIGCSSGSSSGAGSDNSSDSGSDSGSGGTADVSTLASVPSVDISSLDFSQTTTGTSYFPTGLQALSVPTNGIQQLGEDLGAVGNASRAGCEANMHKKEMVRMSQQAQLDRCYPEAMESGGLITIPTDEFAYYKISPPEHSDEEKAQFCDDIPDEFADEKAACQAGEGTGHGNILLRIGNINGALQIDMCEGEEGSESLIDEASYSANNSVYTANVVRIGTWGGHTESNSFSMTVDLGSAGTVTDGTLNLGSDGSASATGQMSGGFGSGTMTFTADAATGSNTITGGFAGEFTDPFSNASTSFTGRVYSQFGGSTNTGTAKFSFTGSMPPFPVSEMVPFGMPESDVTNFLSAFGTELGLQLTSDSLLCPNPDFEPESFDNTVKPMVLANADGSCDAVTHTGVESFSISNGTVTGDFSTEIAQTFTIISNTDSAYFDTVNAVDLATIDPSIGTIAFSRNWDCSGSFTVIDFSSLTASQLTTIDSAMQECFALEEKARGNEGMGGYNCGQQEQQNGVEDFAENGPAFGVYGGDYSRLADDCLNQSPEHIFLDALDPDNNEYCFPAEGGCAPVTISSNNLTDLNISLFGETTITALNFTQSGADPASDVQVFLANPSCVANYTISQPTFDGPQEFGSGDGGFMPQPCVDAGMTSEETCRQLCEDPSVDCAPPEAPVL